MLIYHPSPTIITKWSTQSPTVASTWSVRSRAPSRRLYLQSGTISDKGVPSHMCWPWGSGSSGVSHVLLSQWCGDSAQRGNVSGYRNVRYYAWFLLDIGLRGIYCSDFRWRWNQLEKFVSLQGALHSKCSPHGSTWRSIGDLVQRRHAEAASINRQCTPHGQCLELFPDGVMRVKLHFLMGKRDWLCVKWHYLIRKCDELCAIFVWGIQPHNFAGWPVSGTEKEKSHVIPQFSICPWMLCGELCPMALRKSVFRRDSKLSPISICKAMWRWGTAFTESSQNIVLRGEPQVVSNFHLFI